MRTLKVIDTELRTLQYEREDIHHHYCAHGQTKSPEYASALERNAIQRRVLNTERDQRKAQVALQRAADCGAVLPRGVQTNPRRAKPDDGEAVRGQLSPSRPSSLLDPSSPTYNPELAKFINSII